MNVQRYIEDGKRHFQNGDCDAALDSFSRALEEDRDDGGIYFEIGKVRFVREDYRGAREMLEKSASLLSRDPGMVRHVNVMLAKAYKETGDYRQAASLLQETLRSLSAAGEREEVERELRNVDRDRYGSLLDVSAFGGEYGRLAGEYRRRLRLNPNDEKAIVQLTQVLNSLGRYDEAARFAAENMDRLAADSVFFRNKLLNESEIARGETVLSSKVRSLVVSLSNRCNISCIMCLTSKYRWEVPPERLREIVSLFPYLEKVMWQGGEVFHLDYFPDLLKEAARYPNMRQSIVTNGQLITPETAELLARNNVELTFSVDGTTKGVYEHIRRGARFETLVRNIELVAEMKERYGSNFVMNMNVAVMRSNYRELEEFLEFAARHRFEFLCLMPIHTHLQTDEDIFTRPDGEVLQFISQKSKIIGERAARYGIRVENRLPQVPLPEDPACCGQDSVDGDGCGNEDADSTDNTESPSLNDEYEETPDDGSTEDTAPAGRAMLCHIPWFQLLLDYDGTVRPDCLCSIERSAGSLRESTIDEIWNSPVMQQYREALRAGRHEGLCHHNCREGRIAEYHLKFV